MGSMDYNVINELRLEKRFCDALITVDGARFHAHKNILCGCSSYFRALFTNKLDPQDQNMYSIPGVSADIMELIIEYAYIQDITITEENVYELLVAADYLGVTELVNECCEVLMAHLRPKTCVSIWILAHIYSLKKLKQQAFQMILHNFEEILHNSDEFLDLTVEQLSEIIGHDNLNVKDENVVFDAIVRWTSHSVQERKVQIGALVPMVRLGLLTHNSFIDKVKNNLMTNNAASRQIIHSALMSMISFNPAECLIRPRLPKAIILAIGGLRNNPINPIEAYDSRADCWTQVACKPETRELIHEAVTLNGFVYCFSTRRGDVFRKSVNKFDPVSRIWTKVSSMHSCRLYTGVCVLDGQIYVIGGFNGFKILNTVERYNPEADQWSMIAPMIQRRSNSRAAGLNGKVYVCGGFNGDDLRTAEYYSPQIGHWTLIPSMNSRRSGAGVSAYGGELYAVGGRAAAAYLKSAEVYNPRTNSWRNIPDMMTERGNLGIEVMDDRLFIVGGINWDGATDIVECYDRKTARWCAVKNLRLPRCSLSCCVLSGLPNMAEYIALENYFDKVLKRVSTKKDFTMF